MLDRMRRRDRRVLPLRTGSVGVESHAERRMGPFDWAERTRAQSTKWRRERLVRPGSPGFRTGRLMDEALLRANPVDVPAMAPLALIV